MEDPVDEPGTAGVEALVALGEGAEAAPQKVFRLLPVEQREALVVPELVKLFKEPGTDC